MTLRELQSEICTLGFDRFAELDLTLIYSVKRALQEISQSLCMLRRITLPVGFQSPTTYIKDLHHTGGRTELLPLNGSAFSLSVSGRGEITVFDGKDRRRITFSSERKIIKGLLYGEGTLTLSGTHSYDIFGLALYSEPYFADSDDIPNSADGATIDMKERVTDFLAFAGDITDENGRTVTEAHLTDGKIFLPRCFKGTVTVPYYRSLTAPTLSDADAQIDLPKEYEMLLPLLCASYMLLDIDPEKAEFCRNAYARASSELKKVLYTRTKNDYKDVNGWA